MNKVDFYSQKLAQLAAAKLELAAADTTLEQAIRSMSERSQGCIFVAGEQNKAGIFTERELLMLADTSRDFGTYPLNEVMESRVKFHDLETSCAQALNYLLVRDLRYLPLVSSEGHAILGVRDFFKLAMNDVGHLLEKFDAMKGFNEKAPLILQENEGLSGLKHMMADESFLSSAISRLPLLPCLRVDWLTPVGDVLERMRTRSVSACAVVRWETLLEGIVTERDFLLKVFNRPWNQVANLPIRDFMSANPHALSPKHAMGVAIQNFRNHRYRNLIIIDSDRFPINILGVGDIFKEYLNAIGIISDAELVGARLSA